MKDKLTKKLEEAWAMMEEEGESKIKNVGLGIFDAIKDDILKNSEIWQKLGNELLSRNPKLAKLRDQNKLWLDETNDVDKRIDLMWKNQKLARDYHIEIAQSLKDDGKSRKVAQDIIMASVTNNGMTPKNNLNAMRATNYTRDILDDVYGSKP